MGELFWRKSRTFYWNVLKKGILCLFIYKNIKKKNIFSFLIIMGELFLEKSRTFFRECSQKGDFRFVCL